MHNWWNSLCTVIWQQNPLYSEGCPSIHATDSNEIGSQGACIIHRDRLRMVNDTRQRIRDMAWNLLFAFDLLLTDVIHIPQGYYIATGAILWLPQVQCSNPEENGLTCHTESRRMIIQHYKHNEPVCIFYGTHCMNPDKMAHIFNHWISLLSILFLLPLDKSSYLMQWVKNKILHTSFPKAILWEMINTFHGNFSIISCRGFDWQWVRTLSPTGQNGPCFGR